MVDPRVDRVMLAFAVLLGPLEKKEMLARMVQL